MPSFFDILRRARVEIVSRSNHGGGAHRLQRRGRRFEPVTAHEAKAQATKDFISARMRTHGQRRAKSNEHPTSRVFGEPSRPPEPKSNRFNAVEIQQIQREELSTGVGAGWNPEQGTSYICAWTAWGSCGRLVNSRSRGPA